MGAAEEILESFFAALSNDKLFEKSFLDKLEGLVKAGTLDKVTLRRLIEEVDSSGSKD